LVSFGLRGTVPIFGRAIAKQLLVIIAGLEIEASELEEGNLLYYLHRDSPGFVLQRDKNSVGTNANGVEIKVSEE
jgi:hypothetical protein